MRVAVCFVGQFLRGTNADSGVVRLRHRFAPGFGAHANYDAYIATSTQHFEERPDGPQVNASMLCSNLQSPRGPFDRCEVSTTPYGSGAQYLDAAHGLPLKTSNGLYPHRVASFFSSISKCLDQVYHADVAPKHLRSHTQRLSQPKPLLTDMPSMNHSSTVDSPTSVPHSGSLSHDAQSLPLSMYDAIVVTRLDVLGLVTLHSSLGALLQSVRRGGSGSTHLKVGKKSATSKWEHTIIAGGHGNRRCEDRLFFGPPQLMLPLRFLARDTPHLFSPFRVGVNGKAFNGRTIMSSISDSIIVRSSDTAASSDSRGNSRNRIGKSNSNRTLRSRNGGLTNSIDSVKGAAKSTLYDDLPTRASMSAVVQPATIFSPEALLYEYLSAVAAHEGAHIESVETFASISSRFSSWKQKYGPSFGSYLAQQLNVTGMAFTRSSCRELKNPGAVAGCTTAQAAERKAAKKHHRAGSAH